MTEFPEPGPGTGDATLLLPRYLTFYRETVVRKVLSLPVEEQRTSRVPTGWSPLEMLNHLYFMERRWLVWGFLGEPVDDPWGDGDEAGERWQVDDDVTAEDLAWRLRALGERVDAVVGDHPLEALAPAGPRFEDQPATLGWICFHVLQEYARHAGHLDVAVELAGGEVGE